MSVHTSSKQEDSKGAKIVSFLPALSGQAQKLSTLLFQVEVTISPESELGILYTLLMAH